MTPNAPNEVGGLSTAEAMVRQRTEGRNVLPTPPPRHLHQRIGAQLTSALTVLLLSAACLDLALWFGQGKGDFPFEPLAILGVLVVNVFLGVAQEYRSERALSALRTLAQPFAWILRDGALSRLPAEEIVTGDLLRLESGDRIPADGSVVEQSSLGVDESILTGEPILVDKGAHDSVASGTVVVRGTALVRVEATGPRSTMGRLAQQLSSIETTKAPLERRMDALGRKITWIAGIAAIALVFSGLLSEGFARLGSVVTFAVAFAVAVVPEGLPAMVTLTLALGVERMARRRAVVRRLAAVEGLGSVTVVAADKTGTLTENRASVAKIFTANEERLIEAAVLANDADLDGEAGDPLDVALLAFANQRGVDVQRLRAEHARLSTRPFDAAWRFMRVTVSGPGGITSYLKGAFEVMLARSDATPEAAQELTRIHDAQAALGRRVVAIARCDGEAEERVQLLGLVAIWDPPREGVQDAVAMLRGAGVRVLMITGDHQATAATIAEQVGLALPAVVTGEQLRTLSASERALRLGIVDVVARASAEDKLMIVEALQKSGEVVAMTGDGVNDAPALKRADVGIAMGRRGSDVAREVADMVLLDDDFATIARALEEGRNIYDNIQKFLRFTFATNVALSIVILGGAIGSFWLSIRDSAGALVLPLTALQVLFINFVGDGAPALALAMDRNHHAMLRRPRALNAPLLGGAGLRFILIVGLLQGAIGLGLLVFLPTLGLPIATIQTLVFVYEASTKVLSVYPARRVSGEPARNKALHATTVLGLGLVLSCTLIPPLRAGLGLTGVSGEQLLAIAACVVVTWGISEWLVRASALWPARVPPVA